MHVLATSPSQVMATSLKVGGTVNKEEDINFVKGESSNEEEFWDGDTDW